jgi:hypothetical protein
VTAPAAGRRYDPGMALRRNRSPGEDEMARWFTMILVAGCAGEVEGVCTYEDDAGAALCEDGLSELGCENAGGAFEAGAIGDAATACPDQGYATACGEGAHAGSTLWTKDETCDAL